MNKVVSPVASGLLCLSFVFTPGCANTRDGRNTQAQGTAIGAIAGALLGAALGAATGNRNAIGQYAAVGAGAGAVAGFAYGTRVAARKAKYRSAEQWLNAEIALAKQSNSRAYAYNASLKNRIAALEARSRAASTAAARRSIKKEAAIIRNQIATQNRAESTSIEDQKAVTGYQDARSANNYGAYQREVNSFNQARAERGRLGDRLASLDQSVDR